MTSDSLVSIIIVNWNGLAETQACLRSLEDLAYPNYRVIVVDNGSSDGSKSVLNSMTDISLLHNSRNVGFTGGNNIGLEYASTIGAQYSLLLNHDTEVAPDFLDRLVEAAEQDPQIGIVGPSIYYFDQPNTLWSAGGSIDWARGWTEMQGIGQKDEGQFGDKPREVDFISGCALLVRMSVVAEVGMLDQRFFAYYEDTEWCLRVANSGYKLLHVPSAKVWHKISVQSRSESPRVHYYMTRNRLLFLRAARVSWRAWLYTLVVDYLRTLLSWSLRPKWREKRSLRGTMWRAIQDGVRGRFGPAPAGL